MDKVVFQGERSLESFCVERSKEEKAEHDRLWMERFTKRLEEIRQRQQQMPTYRLSQFIHDAGGFLEILDDRELNDLGQILADAIQHKDRVAVKSVRAILESYPEYERAIGMEVDDESVDDGPLHFSDDYRSARWGNLSFRFSIKQSAVMEILHRNWLRRTPELSKQALLEAANSDGKDVRDLFRGHDAWNTLIVLGTSPGTRRLAPKSP